MGQNHPRNSNILRACSTLWRQKLSAEQISIFLQLICIYRTEILKINKEYIGTWFIKNPIPKFLEILEKNFQNTV